jgi:lysophospholipase L1-like esterase
VTAFRLEDRIRLCMVGDSISNNKWCYTFRGELDRLAGKMPAHRSTVRFVGVVGANVNEPYLHCATDGITAASLAAALPGYDVRGTPTDVTICAGTNDLGAALTPAQTYTNVETLRDAVATRWPSARIWLVLIPPNKAPSTRDTTTTNNLLAAMTGVTVVDTRVDWNTTTMMSADGYHPSALGYDVMGAKIATAISAVL